MAASTSIPRIRAALTTPPIFSANAPRLKTNLDTNFLKLIAVFSMLIDHIGGAFFPEVGWFRWIGRLAFPIFCYCMTVGLLYTRDIKKYLFRLGLFAVISQPFYVLAFHPHDFVSQLTNWNIFCTLFLSLLAMYGLKERKWWLFFAALFVVSWWNFDYSGTGVQYMLIFYLCRNHPAVGAGLYCAQFLFGLGHASTADPLNLVIGHFAIDWSFFAIFAALFLFLPTHFNPKIPKWVFYVFYPMHLAGIALLQIVIF